MIISDSFIIYPISIIFKSYLINFFKSFNLREPKFRCRVPLWVETQQDQV
jgi:hypothetical protein